MPSVLTPKSKSSRELNIGEDTVPIWDEWLTALK